MSSGGVLSTNTVPTGRGLRDSVYAVSRMTFKGLHTSWHFTEVGCHYFRQPGPR